MAVSSLVPTDSSRWAINRVVRILYIGFKHDYGKPERGLSFEHLNFLGTLRQMEGYEVSAFHCDEVMRTVGRRGMNSQLLHCVRELKPEVCFFTLFTDEFDRETIHTITKHSGALTLNWFSDDHWRFQNFSRHWASLFSWVVTTDAGAVEKYYSIGCRNVVNTQWAFDPSIYKPYDLPQDHDVTFVGQVHSSRRRIIQAMSHHGLNVSCWGRGWPNGRIAQEEMVRMFSRSKINLNFTESSMGFHWKPVAKVFLTRRLDDSIRLNWPREIVDSIKVLFSNLQPQIKGRNFEIPGSGGFLMTSDADSLETYFEPGKEVVVFSDVSDLIDKVRYYLSHDSEREQIRKAGHARALKDHTFKKRFSDIFKTIGVVP